MRSKGISPVIATVIIVAVAIAIAIAVAFWLTGIVGIFTGRVEQLEIVAARAEYDSNNNTYTITVIVKNSGTSPATIDGVFITPTSVATGAAANCSAGSSGPDINNVNTNSDCKVEPGGSVTVTITGISGNAGQSVEVKLHSAGGKEYPKLVVLP
ncbi:MAG: DUF4352 domain-containing protein [Thermoprotei archaeon]|nr:MAG: DUF4352 domain-containing protein [Thermoprotei archaeon]